MTTATISPITSSGLISAKHPIRGEFSEWSTGNDRGDYYRNKGLAINAFDGVLQGYDLCLDRNDLDDFHGDDGEKYIQVHDEFDRCVGYAVLSWYRMPSGNYEFIGYLA
jgi:hypothetical protein